jgi:Tol biopolymer transport system component
VTLVAFVGAALFALLGGGAQSQNEAPALSARSSLAGATSSKIAFLRARASRGGFALWVMNDDGSEERQLAGGTSSFNPAWSPDGQKIAFQTQRGRQYEVYLTNADGTGKRNLTRNRASDGVPSWSPDGRLIAFYRWDAPGSGDLYVMNADGSGQRLLAPNVWGYSASWSPDGRKIAFERALDIYVMNADGSGERNLTRTAQYESAPAWSPDGRRIAFVRESSLDTDIYVMNADGSDQRRLTRNSGSDTGPAWSPDGRKVGFASDRHGASVYVMNADGSRQRRLPVNIGKKEPTWGWSADGRKVALAGIGGGGGGSIYVVNADGSGLRQLTRPPRGWGDWAPVWSPVQK